MRLIKIFLNNAESKRLFSKIVVDPITNCWNWTRARDGFGYGYFRYKRHTYRVHRFVYAWLKNPLPTARYGKGVPVLDHICKNTSCCNPDHLELVSQKENMLRGSSPMAIHSKQTHCIKGHLLPDSKKESKNGRPTRRCVLCRRANRMRRYYASKEV
jgi:hypothetical protein